MSDLIDDLTHDAALMTAVRRDFHAHPELGFAETRTSGRVAHLLADWGYDVVREVGGTGVVASLTRGSGRRIGLRAELDALPVRDIGASSHASINHSASHAAGHDGHMAMLLAAGRYLARAGRVTGTVRLIFQPAGEGLGGAARMLEDGLLDRFPCDALFAPHSAADLRAGTLATRSGVMGAAGDWLDVMIVGAACNGGADAAVIAAALVMALQSNIVGRLDPSETATVHVASLQAGSDLARVTIVVRSLGDACRTRVLDALRDLIVRHVASFGGQTEIIPALSLPHLINTVEETRLVIEVAQDVLGENSIVAPRMVRPIMASDDFGVLLQSMPGCYFLLGTQGNTPSRLYHPGYDFNDACLQPGATLLARIVERFLLFGRRSWTKPPQAADLSCVKVKSGEP